MNRILNDIDHIDIFIICVNACVSIVRSHISECVLISGEEDAHTQRLVWLKPRTLSRVVDACLSVMVDAADEDMELMVERTVRVLDAVVYMTSGLKSIQIHFRRLYKISLKKDKCRCEAKI